MRTILTAAAAALTLTACTAHHTDPGPATPPATATPAAQEGPAKLGTAQTTSGEGVVIRATAYRYRRLHSTVPAPHGRIYAGADVKACVVKAPAGKTVGVSWMPWTLGFADDSSVDPVSEWSPDTFDVHLYPADDRPLRPGQCMRGWVLYSLRKGERPTTVSYEPQSSSPAAWRIG